VVAYSRDPLAALIADLERAVSPDALKVDAADWHDQFVTMQRFVQFIWSHEDMPASERDALMEQQPWYERFMAWLDRSARYRPAT
jgi:hypothetical protein